MEQGPSRPDHSKLAVAIARPVVWDPVPQADPQPKRKIELEPELEPEHEPKRRPQHWKKFAMKCESIRIRVVPPTLKKFNAIYINVYTA